MAPSSSSSWSSSSRSSWLALLLAVCLVLLSTTARASVAATGESRLSSEPSTATGIVTLTDQNYEDLLFDTTQDTAATWAILIASSKDEVYRDTFVDVATSETELAKEYRYATIDYDAEGAQLLLTRWLIFRSPYIVFATNRGRDLYFFYSKEVCGDRGRLRGALKHKTWLERGKRWSGMFAPGGIVYPYLAKTGPAVKLYHSTLGQLPSWVVLLVSLAASKLIQDSLNRDRARAEAIKPAEKPHTE